MEVTGANRRKRNKYENMKRLKVSLMVLLTCVLAGLFTGCATTSTGGKGIVMDAQTIQDSAVILRNAARDAAALAIQQNPQNKPYVTLAVATLNTFLVGSDYTPGALTAALTPIVKQVKDVRISLAINTVTDVYEVFYGRYAKQQIAGNVTANLFLTALRDGAAQALTITDVGK